MMKIYRIEMMDYTSFNNYMCGGYNYRVEYYDVVAENKKQALVIAKQDNPDYFINKAYVQEVNKQEYTTSQKDNLIAHIAQLEEQLIKAKEKLQKLENRG